MEIKIQKWKTFTLIKRKAYDRSMDSVKSSRDHNSIDKLRRDTKVAFTLIELIVVMAVIGILVLLAAPKFLGYTEKANETKHIHTAKVIETALEAYLINGGLFPDDLEMIDIVTLELAAGNESLIGVEGYISSVDAGVYYELTHEFIKKLDVKISAKSSVFVDVMASSVPTAVYASEKGITFVDTAKTLKGYELQSGELPNEITESKPIKIASGYAHTLALMEDGTVWSWGYNNYGETGQSLLGNGLSPKKVQSLDNIIDIAAGFKHSIFLKNDGTVLSLGYNPYGQLGDGTKNNSSNPVFVAGLNDVKSIAAGEHFSMALKNDGSVWAWGRNSHGELGDSTNVDSLTPVRVKNLDNIKSIAAGYKHAIALRSDGTIWSWGINSDGQLGNNSYISKSAPIQIPGMTNINSITAGTSHSIALKNDGTVWAWGYNFSGQLGNGLTGNNPKPTQINNLINIADIYSGNVHSFAVNQAGNAFVWGSMSTKANKSPIQVQGISSVKHISAGLSNGIFLEADNEIWGWGLNQYGQLGDGTIEYRNNPVQITIE